MIPESQYLIELLEFAKDPGTNKFDIIQDIETRIEVIERCYSDEDVKEIEAIKETVTN